MRFTLKYPPFISGILTAIFIGIVISSFSSDDDVFYRIFNNQTTAVLIGAILITLGFQTWQRQHKVELRDKYIETITESFLTEVLVRREFHILRGKDQKEADYLFEKIATQVSRQKAYLILLGLAGHNDFVAKFADLISNNREKLQLLESKFPDQKMQISEEYFNEYFDLGSDCENEMADFLLEEVPKLDS